jgi:hypothetical protein
VDAIVLTVLVLAEKRQVEENSQRLGIGGEDDNLRDTSVQGLGGLVGALLQLTGVCWKRESVRVQMAYQSSEGWDIR